MKLFVFMGASGSGKSTIQHSLPIRFMTNYTTRPLRTGEIDGFHINYVTKQRFEELVREDAFFEYAMYADNYYGTAKHSIDRMLEDGIPFHCTKDVNGANALKEGLGNKAVIIYIKPPSVDVLKDRMSCRGDKIEDIEARIQYIEKTQELENEKYADYIITNDDLTEAKLEAHNIVLRELLN